MRNRLKVVLPIGIITLIAVGLLSSWTVWQLREAIRYERQSYAVQSNVDDLYELVQGAESSQRGYLITGKEEYLNTYLNSYPRIPAAYAKLKHSVRSLSLKPQQLEELDDLLERKLDELKQTVILQQSEKEDDALALFQTDRGETLMVRLHEALDAIDQQAVRDAQLHEGFVRRYGTVLIFAIGFGSALTLALVLIFAFLSREEIRQRIRTEHELRSAQDAALVASKLKSQFLATVSHEIRTPLNGIIGMSDLLRVRLQEPELRRFVDIIHNSGNALLKIVNDILDFSKIEAGKVDFEYSEFSILDVVESTSDLFAARAREKGLRLYSFVDSSLPTSVLGDVSRTSQILRNLISNAVKFTNSGGILIRVRLRFQSGSKSVVRFEVQDTGLGVSPENQKILFQPFNQVGGDTHQEGTGLGLSICKDLVVSMGGQIGMESQTDHGSTFWFELPLKDMSHLTLSSAAADLPKGETIICFSQSALLDQVIALYASDLHFEARCVDVFDSETESLVREKKAAVVIDLEGRTAAEIEDLIRLSREAQATSIILLGRSQLEDLPPEIERASFATLLGSPFRRDQWLEILRKGTASHVEATNRQTMQGQSSVPYSQLESKVTATSPVVLLVEDNQTNQLVAELILQGLGYRVHTVANGKEALEALSRITYDAVLMDCQMPVMDGFTATAEIRRQEQATGHHTPIIAMTANALASDREKCLASGMDDFIAKPFQPEDLNARLQKWLKPESKSAVDWSVLHQLAQKTNETVVARLIQSFLKTLPTSLEAIRSAQSTQDLKAMKSWAHQLKSSCGTLGALELQTMCSELEVAIEADGRDSIVDASQSPTVEKLAADLLGHGEDVLEAFKKQSRYKT